MGTQAAGQAAGDGRLLPFLERAGDAGSTREKRLGALRELLAAVPAARRGGALVPVSAGEVNNHIHTVYSFSPYTPSMAAWKARDSGLAVAGSVDHDSVGAALEMLEACALLGIGGTVGYEIRVSMAGTPFVERKLNNPDSTGIAYMTVQGLPRHSVAAAADFLKPISAARGRRNRRTTAAASALLASAGYRSLDYDRDVLPLSLAAEGGSVTERHILAAVAVSLVERLGKGPALVAGLSRDFGINAPPRVASWLADGGNPHYTYDLLGLLKSGFLDRVFVQPGPDECLPVSAAIDFARGAGAIAAYAYLGDVADSPTGDKKAESFEDSYLDELVPWVAQAGFTALTYMPPRNTPAQLGRLRGLCEEAGLMEISGVDINSPRQSFNCPEVLGPGMSRLLDTTWALVAHERLSGLDPALGLFSPDSPLAARPLAERIGLYAATGRSLDPEKPDDPDALSRATRGWRT